jgi:hypothetical protein
VLLACASTARAEGPGVKLGNQLVLHPGIAVELRYDSNVFFGAGTPNSPAIGSLIFRALPSLDLATRPQQRGGGVPHALDFRLHLGADYNEFLTGGPVVTNHRSIGAQAGLLLTLLPYHVFTTDVFDNYVRTVQPPYQGEPYNLDRDTNEAGARFRLRPGGGRLEFDLSYTFGLDFFEPQSNPVGAHLQDLNVYYHRINLHGQWAFFPKTAVYVDVTETPYVYSNASAAAALGHTNSFPVRAIAGMTGLITTKLTLNAWIGYGNGIYQSNAGKSVPNPNTALGGIDVRWRPTILSTGGLGYHHDFLNSLLGDYYDLDAVYVSWAQVIWRFTGSLKLQYQSLRYAGIPSGLSQPPTGPPATPTLVSRNDNNIVFDLRVDYPFKDWLFASVGYTLTYNNSDSSLPSMGTGGTPLVLPLDYTKHEGWLRLSLLY